MQSIQIVSSSKLPPRLGFTTVRGLSAIALLAIIAAITFPTIQKTKSGAQISKLESDVAAINRAVHMYIVSGGSLDSITDPQAVLEKLKTLENRDGKYIGVRGSMIDERLTIRTQTEDEAYTAQPRAFWYPEKRRFKIESGGLTGIAEFYLDEAVATIDYGSISENEDSTGGSLQGPTEFLLQKEEVQEAATAGR